MKLIIVVPCYNEEAVLPETVKRLEVVIDKLAQLDEPLKGGILFVDDGSKDATWKLIHSYSDSHENISGLKLAHNVGHQNALWAGMEQVAGKCDAMVSIDADLQDDENAIVEMARQFLQGKDVVYGVRKERKTDTFFKRWTAQCFYKLMRTGGSDVVYNHADFRLLSSRALSALISFPERNLFIRGMVRLLGYNEGFVYYDRRERFAGSSKYPLGKMISFAVDGITSFSITPLRLIMFTGFAFMLISILMIIYALIRYFEGAAIEGWTSLLVSVWFIGGTLLMAIGIIGSYIGKIYKEIKHRPRYLVQERCRI